MSIELRMLNLTDSEVEAAIKFMQIKNLDMLEFLQHAVKTFIPYRVNQILTTHQDLTEVSTHDLRYLEYYKTKVHRPAELLFRCFEALKIHNATCEMYGDRWKVTKSVLKALSGCNTDSVIAFYELHEAAIDDYNQQMNLNTHKLNVKDKKVQDMVDIVALYPHRRI